MDLSPEKLRPHWHALSAKASAIHENLEPLRVELAEIVAGTAKLSLADAKVREAEIRKIIVAEQQRLAPIERERATVARALGGKTGPLQDDAAFLRDDAAVFYFSVTDLVWFHDADNPTDPDPAPGVVTAVTGENDFTVEITLADDSTQTEKHVGTVAANSARYIEPRDRDGGPLGG